MDVLVVVDCQNDFIDGSLACHHSHEAVENIVKFIKENKVSPVYSMDWHSRENKSFKENGGIWPVHCVRDTQGSELSKVFFEKLDGKNIPNEENTFKKGMDDVVEEYSAFNSKNAHGTKIHELDAKTFYVCGIASEFCVRETVLELKKHGKNVLLLEDLLGYVDEENHKKNIEELKKMGVEVL